MSIINEIRELHRQRQDLVRTQASMTLRIKAIMRRMCSGVLSEKLKAGEINREDFLKLSKKEADKLYAAVTKNGEYEGSEKAAVITGPYFESRDVLERNRKLIEKRLERAAKQLPILSWVESIKGLGVGSLAAIVGECGDLANYSTHSKVWKRLGLAPIDGKAASTWRMKGGLNADQWTAAGYSPARRSVIWNVGASVLKAQSERVDKETGELMKTAGHYRSIYDARKQYELDRGIPKGHAHNRATRYMEKAIVRDLWKAWNGKLTEAGDRNENEELSSAQACPAG